MINGLDHDLAARLVGVIDLQQGRAVHAIAGNRTSYRDVSFCHGDPWLLARHYRRLGLTRIYLADLDAIGGLPLQIECLESLLALGFEQTAIDVGWSGNEDALTRQHIRSLAERYPHAAWIAATESSRGPETLAELKRSVAPGAVFLGLDYREGKLIAPGVHQPDPEQTRPEESRPEAPSPAKCRIDERTWLAAATELDCQGVIVLDLAGVGTAAGPRTVETIRRIHAAAPQLALFSGGGVRDPIDAQQLLAAGCQGVLMATALYPRPSAESSKVEAD